MFSKALTFNLKVIIFARGGLVQRTTHWFTIADYTNLEVRRKFINTGTIHNSGYRDMMP